MNVTFKCISFVKNSTMERDFKLFVQNIKWAMSALKSSTENIKIFFYLRSFDSKQLKTFLNVKSALNAFCRWMEKRKIK